MAGAARRPASTKDAAAARIRRVTAVPPGRVPRSSVDRAHTECCPPTLGLSTTPCRTPWPPTGSWPPRARASRARDRRLRP